MPLTEAGAKVLATMIKKYGKKRGEEIFYKSIAKGTPGSQKWHRKVMRNNHEMT